MTERRDGAERREVDRRREDKRLARIAAEVLEKRLTEEWERADAVHVGLEAAIQELRENQSKLVGLLVGVKADPLKGIKASRGLVNSVETLADDVEWLKGEISNGGLKIRLPVMAWVGLGAAVITGVFTIWAALIGIG